MGNFGYKQFAERHRPHIHPPGATLFVTYRLVDSIPKSTIRFYKAMKEWLNDQMKRAKTSEVSDWRQRVEKFDREWFVKFEEILHDATTGPMWMQDERVAAKVADSLCHLDGKAYRLDAYSIMSNHVHAVLKPFLSVENIIEAQDERGRPIFVSEFPSLARIMQLIKGRSARECNLVL